MKTLKLIVIEATIFFFQALEEKSAKLVKFSDKVVVTSKLVATGNTTGNKKVSEAILSTAGQIESLTPQLVNAGMIYDIKY